MAAPDKRLDTAEPMFVAAAQATAGYGNYNHSPAKPIVGCASCPAVYGSAACLLIFAKGSYRLDIRLLQVFRVATYCECQ
jgi:hypothetical protein